MAPVRSSLPKTGRAGPTAAKAAGCVLNMAGARAPGASAMGAARGSRGGGQGRNVGRPGRPKPACRGCGSPLPRRLRLRPTSWQVFGRRSPVKDTAAPMNDRRTDVRSIVTLVETRRPLIDFWTFGFEVTLPKWTKLTSVYFGKLMR